MDFGQNQAHKPIITYCYEVLGIFLNFYFFRPHYCELCIILESGPITYRSTGEPCHSICNHSLATSHTLIEAQRQSRFIVSGCEKSHWSVRPYTPLACLPNSRPGNETSMFAYYNYMSGSAGTSSGPMAGEIAV